MRVFYWAWVFSSFLVSSSYAENATTIDELHAAGLPLCSAECLAKAAPRFGCDALDPRCTCMNTNLTEALQVCMAPSCTPKEGLTALKFFATTCEAPVRDRGPALRRLVWSMFGLSVLAVGLRFMARSPAFDGPGYGADDWTMLVALGLMVWNEVNYEQMIQGGLGQDAWMLAPNFNRITSLLKFFWLDEMCYTIIVNSTKISILLLYLRIFSSAVATWFRTTCFALIGICTAATIGIVISLVFECSPVSAGYTRWTNAEPHTCVNIGAQGVMMASLNILLDLIIFFLPIPKVLKLNASIHKRLGVSLTFLVGLFVTIVSVVRLIKLIELNTDLQNITWGLVPLAVWSQAETSVGVICACMPSFARLVRQVWSATVGSYVTKVTQHLSSDRAKEKRHSSNGRGLSKTVETSIVYATKVGSNDEIQLVDKGSSRSDTTVEGGYGAGYEHNYTRMWYDS